MEHLKTNPSQPPLLIRSHSLTQQEDTLLQHLSRDASDFLGRSISSSAVIRALIRQVVKQGPAAADALFLEVERELNAGVMWGKQR
jgi:hypothetical protein